MFTARKKYGIQIVQIYKLDQARYQAGNVLVKLKSPQTEKWDDRKIYRVM